MVFGNLNGLDVEVRHNLNLCCVFIDALEGSQPEREAGRDGDLPRYLVPAGGHASEVL